MPTKWKRVHERREHGVSGSNQESEGHEIGGGRPSPTGGEGSVVGNTREERGAGIMEDPGRMKNGEVGPKEGSPRRSRTLLPCAALSSICRYARPQSLGPADRIGIWTISAFSGGARKHRWESCTRPSRPLPASSGCSWIRRGVPLVPGEGFCGSGDPKIEF